MPCYSAAPLTQHIGLQDDVAKQVAHSDAGLQGVACKEVVVPKAGEDDHAEVEGEEVTASREQMSQGRVHCCVHVCTAYMLQGRVHCCVHDS